jgi:dTDP-4-amino-4,6-dideoxygalactose transaminase
MTKKTFVTKPFIGNIESITKAISTAIENKALTNHGPQHALLTENLKNYLNVPNLSLFCNGTIALLTALKSLELTGEVHAIEWAGLTPVFCDIDPDSMCIDPDKIEALITSKTSAILGVHVYGIPCDLRKIDALRKRYNLKVVYDAAHAFLTQIDGRSLSEFGDVSMLSFHATKIFNTIEGGALVYHDPTLEESLFLRQNFGIKDQGDIRCSGINGKLSEIHSIVGLYNLESLGSEITRRQVLFDLYSEQLGRLNGVKLMTVPQNVTNGLQYFPILIDSSRTKTNSDLVKIALSERQIYTRRYFYPLCSNYPHYTSFESASKELLPIANRISEEVLCLPFYGELDHEKALEICAVIKSLI